MSLDVLCTRQSALACLHVQDDDPQAFGNCRQVLGLLISSVLEDDHWCFRFSRLYEQQKKKILRVLRRIDALEVLVVEPDVSDYDSASATDTDATVAGITRKLKQLAATLIIKGDQLLGMSNHNDTSLCLQQRVLQCCCLRTALTRPSCCKWCSKTTSGPLTRNRPIRVKDPPFGVWYCLFGVAMEGIYSHRVGCY